ncbi:hypothetical protein Daus18300_008047 [Diaporthe australafricana]|uniref:NmrA-like domain-containing protein n=1 Tax=Diaporthe australafricana TaxID=127596 RepID=A0ABR3WJU2_9PEZI
MSGGLSQELNHGKKVADVSEKAWVQHLIFSSLVRVTDETKGRLRHIEYFDMKADIERCIRSKGILSAFVLQGYFIGNLTASQMLKKGDDGVLSLACPVSDKAKFPLIYIESDIAIRNGSEVLGKQILAAAGYHTPTHLLSELEELTNNNTRFVQLETET